MYTVGISETLQQEMQTENDSKSIMGKDDFLQLLVTQMKHQDPLNPMSNTEYAAQLAQYSSLEQLQQLNDSAESQLILGQSLNNSFMTSIIGKDVKAFGNGIELQDGDANIHYNLSRAASDVNINIYDESGNLVKTMNIDGANAGDQTTVWNGKNEDGEEMDAGNYSFTVEATDSSGMDVSAMSYSYGLVNGISYHQGSPYLDVNGQLVNLGDVISINMADIADSTITSDVNSNNSNSNTDENYSVIDQIFGKIFKSNMGGNYDK